MDNKDTFHTFRYKGGFVHTCWNRTKSVEEVSVLRYEGDRAKPVVSVYAAKLIIGKYEAKVKKS